MKYECLLVAGLGAESLFNSSLREVDFGSSGGSMVIMAGGVIDADPDSAWLIWSGRSRNRLKNSRAMSTL